jgi:hypothetical protein
MMKKQFLFLPLATLALGLAACSEQADFTQADVVNKAVETANAGDVPDRTQVPVSHNHSRRSPSVCGGSFSSHKIWRFQLFVLTLQRDKR